MDLQFIERVVLDELEKIALTRSVKEWRAANAAGNEGAANQIAQGSAQLGNKPRYLEDISLGGEEAGVDKMMGHAGAQAPTAPALQQRLEQYKANKGELGVAGRSPTQSVMSSPEGRGALLRGTQAAPQAAAPNESGLMARKLYKPDSTISRGEFTPQLLAQKQQVTDAARSLSPEAKAMVPAMYGHATAGTGGLQRSTSTHEFVPGISDLRGKNIGSEDQKIWSRGQQGRQDLSNIQEKVLNPMAAKGHTMADTVSASGTNYGNVVNSPQGPKVLDFLPQSKGQLNPAIQSFGKYAPTKTQFAEGEAHGNMQSLRKEVFNPKMNIQEASPEMQSKAQQVLMGKAPSLTSAAAPNPAANTPTVRPGSGALAAAPTTPVPQQAARTAPTAAVSARPPASVGSSAFAPTMHAGATPAVGGMLHAPTAAPGKLLGAAERGAATKVPGLLRKATPALSHMHL
jgi:hypothetical protein